MFAFGTTELGIMRKAIIGGLVLLVLLGGLATYGLLTPTISHTFEVTVDRPVIPVFSKLVSVNDMPQWVRGLERTEPVGFNPIPGLPVGTYNLFYTQGISSRHFRMDILTVNPLQKVKVRLSNDIMELECTGIFTPQGDRTHMTLETVTRGKGLLAKMALPYFKWRLVAETEENMARLQEILENK